QNFKPLIEDSPKSKYAADSRKRMAFILDKMARRELYVARYYMKQGAYLAAANRGQYVLENYPNSPRVETALELMIESYDQLGLEDMKNDSIIVLKLNYPDNQTIR
ncbi:MAG: outer membrane protein assembly factor BamD, partial [Psychrosphaera sp.]|nr:outer membrane protein assembly factor BamD [Psychrosphaera sp.]